MMKNEKKKVMRFEIRRGQNDFIFLKNMFCKSKKHIYFYCFLAGFLALHFKDDL